MENRGNRERTGWLWCLLGVCLLLGAGLWTTWRASGEAGPAGLALADVEGVLDERVGTSGKHQGIEGNKNFYKRDGGEAVFGETGEDFRGQVEARWQGATVLAHGRASGLAGEAVEAILVQPRGLPYPVRMERGLADGNVREYVGSRVIFRPLERENAGLFEELERMTGGTVRPVGQLGQYVLEAERAELGTISQLMAALETFRDELVYAEADHILRLALTEPNDPEYQGGRLWGQHNTGQAALSGDDDTGTIGVADADMDLPEAWDIRNSAETIVVAVVDTGVRTTHQDLAGNLWVNPGEVPGNGLDDDGNGWVDDVHGINAITDTGDPSDDHGHGTHVSGTIGAIGNNGVGVVGVAWDVRIMACKFIAEEGGGATSDAIKCIDYAMANGARILNNSWGGTIMSQALLDTVRSTREAGVLFVAAAGNEGWDNDLGSKFPTNYPVDTVVSVAATNRRGERADFSNFGLMVHLGAPGDAIYSCSDESDTAYTSMSGTSMAAPQVSGTLALLMAQFPRDTAYQLVNRLLNTVSPLEGLEGKTLSGGQVNVHQALLSGVEQTRPLNDDFARRMVLTGDVNRIRLINHGGTRELGEPLHGGSEANDTTVWFEYEVANPGIVGIDLNQSGMELVAAAYTGDSISGLEPVGFLEQTAYNTFRFTGEPGIPYQIAISGNSGSEGLVAGTISGPPPNNDFANASLLEGLPVFARGRLVNADKEPGELDHAGNAGGASIWFKWIAPVSGWVAATTRVSLGDQPDTLLAVYTSDLPDPGMSDLERIAENDNEPGLASSRVRFPIVQGRSYYLAIDGKDGEPFESVSLNIVQPPQNDDFADAFPLSGAEIDVTSTANYASSQPGEPLHGGQRGAGSIWYRWTTADNVIIGIDTNGSSADTLLGVYTGDSVDALERVASDDDSGEGSASRVQFTASRFVTYHIAIDSVSQISSGEVKLHFAPVVVPTNDQFANAIRMEGRTAEAGGSTQGASREAMEPGRGQANFGDSVWFRWVAPDNGPYGIYVDGLDGYDVNAAVYTGENVGSLTEAAFDRDSGIGKDAFAEFQAVAGSEYSIQVTGFGDAQGDFTLEIRPATDWRPLNDRYSEAVPLDPDEVVFGYKTHNMACTREAGEPLHAGMDSGRSLWWKVDIGAGQAGKYVFSTSGSQPDEVGIAVYRAADPGNPSVADLVLVTDNTPHTDLFYTEASWDADEDTRYYIAVDNMRELTDGKRKLVSGRLVTHFQKVPENDFFSRARPLVEGEKVVACNFGATRETYEPDIGDGRGRKSLWWTFAPSKTGTYRIETIGSRRVRYEDSDQELYMGGDFFGMDTHLGLFSGSDMASAVLVAQNDSYTNESYDVTWSTVVRNSRLIHNLEAGLTYHIKVDGENVTFDPVEDLGTITGQIHLLAERLLPPSNDDIADAIEIADSEYRQFLFNNFGATREAGEPIHGIAGSQSLWWRWTAPHSGTWHASTAGNLYDNGHVRGSGIGVYTGNSVDSLTTVVKNRDGAGPNTNSFSLATFEAVAGQTYHIAVDTPSTPVGGTGRQGNISLILTPSPANDNFDDAIEMRGSRWQATGHNIGATGEPGEPMIEYWFEPPDVNVKSVWWKWTAPASGLVDVDTIGSELYSVLAVYIGDSVDSLTAVAGFWNSGNPWNSAERPILGSAWLSFMAEAGTTYHFCVQGAGFIEPSAGPVLLNLEGPPAPPASPRNFTAERVRPVEVQLAWDDRSIDELTYVVERSTDGVSWAEVARTAQDAESFSDLSAEPSVKRYYYRIHGEGPGGVGDSVVAVTGGMTFGIWAILNGIDSSATADLDGDGIPNLLEYALGLDPLSPGEESLPVGKVLNLDGQLVLYLSFTLPPDRSDLVYSVRHSINLSDWSDGLLWSSLDADETHVLGHTFLESGDELWDIGVALDPLAPISGYLRLIVEQQ